RVQRGIEQRVAVESKERIAVPRREGAGASKACRYWLRRTRQVLNELKQRLFRLAHPLGKLLMQNTGNFPCACLGGSIGRTVSQGLARWLQAAQFGVKKI